MKSITLVFAFIVINNLSAQQSVNTGGGNTTNSSGSVSFSIGQLVFNTQITTGGSIRQGVQQAFEILNVSGIDQIKLTYNVNIYPIPASDFLTLTFIVTFTLKGSVSKRMRTFPLSFLSSLSHSL